MGIYYFDKHAYVGNQIILDLAEELGESNNLKKAERILKAVLHTLRDKMTIEASLQLMWQLPLFLKGIYASEWRYRTAPLKIEHPGEFIEAVKIKDYATGNQDFTHTDSTLHAIMSVFKVLGSYMTAREWQLILDNLPDALHVLLQPALTKG